MQNCAGLLSLLYVLFVRLQMLAEADNKVGTVLGDRLAGGCLRPADVTIEATRTEVARLVAVQVQQGVIDGVQRRF